MSGKISINRTKLELKPRSIRLMIYQMIAINRTKLELKPHGHFATNAARFVYQSYQTGIETKFGMLGRIKWCAINRTKLELKRITSTARLSTSILSIVPNWN